MQHVAAKEPAKRVVVASDGRNAVSRLRHFFSVGFGCVTRVAEKIDASDPLLNGQDQADIFVFLVSSFGAEEKKILCAVRALDRKPFVLIASRVRDAETTVQMFLHGADEVLNYPFSLMELAYRLRSRSGQIGEVFQFEVDELRNLDLGAEMVHRANLTDTEAQVVQVLMEHEGMIVSRDALSLAIDKSPWNYGNRKFDVHVARIRKKLIEAYGSNLTVETVRSAGYILTLNER